MRTSNLNKVNDVHVSPWHFEKTLEATITESGGGRVYTQCVQVGFFFFRANRGQAAQLSPSFRHTVHGVCP